jgi:hypothetical protein
MVVQPLWILLWSPRPSPRPQPTTTMYSHKKPKAKSCTTFTFTLNKAEVHTVRIFSLADVAYQFQRSPIIWH